MRWVSWSFVAVFASCNGDKDETLPAGSGDTGDADTDADTDADADADSDADSDVEPNGDGEIRFAHLNGPFGGMDLYVDGLTDPALSAMPFMGSGWRALEGGARTFTAVAVGGDPALSPLVANVDIASGERFTLALLGTEAAPLFFASKDDNTGLAMNEIRYVFWNAVPGIDSMGLIDSDAGQPLVSDLPYGTSTGIDRSPGPLRIEVDVERDGVSDYGFVLEGLPPNVVVPVWFAQSGNNLVMVGYSPQGALNIVAPTVLEPPETGDTSGQPPAPTGDTSAPPAPTGDTSAPIDTSDTGAPGGDTADTADTGS